MRSEKVDDIFNSCKGIKYLQTIRGYFTEMIEGTQNAIDHKWNNNEIKFSCRGGFYDEYDCHLEEIKGKGFEELTHKIMREYLVFLEKVKALTADELNKNINILENYE